MTDLRLVLGIDGGGTKTEAVLSRFGFGDVAALPDGPEQQSAREDIGRGLAGPSNPRSVGFDAACEAIETAVNAAFQSAGIPRRKAAAAVVGMAGAGRPDEQERLLAWANQTQLAERIRVTHDAELVLSVDGATGNRIALIAGTGSFAFGSTDAAATARAGGWGYLFGDEGSGYAMGIATLRSVAMAVDGRGPSTRLLERLLAHLDIESPPAIVSAVYSNSFDRSCVAAIAEILLEEAKRGDPVATRIARDATLDLATAVHAVASRLEMEPRSFRLTFAGGLLTGSEYFCELTREACSKLSLPPNEITLAKQPSLGAVRLACGLCVS